MENPLKRFGAWGIGLRRDLFLWARIKLSVLYLVVVACILAFYSWAIYTNVVDRVRDNPYRIQNPEEQAFYDRAVDEARDFILIIDGVVLAATAGFGYLLAGYTLKPIREALEAQEAFSADASHELRTPLAVMRTDIEVLLRSGEPVPEKARKVLRSNLEEIQSLSLMSEELLALSRGGAGSVASWTDIDFGVLVRGAADKFKNLAAERGIRLLIGDVAAIRVRGDARSLERVLTNVLANALAYTPREGTIEMSLARNQGKAELVIADTGIGIAKNDLLHVFDRFYKADHARTDGESGAGLGLSIVRQIVERHRGTIHLESAIGKGTTVFVMLPAAE